MTLSQRTKYAIVTALVVVIGLWALLMRPPSAPDSNLPEVVRIGFQTIPNGEVIVKEQGWFDNALEELGVRVEWIDFASGSDVNAALASGDIDLGLVGSTLFAIGIERGIAYELIWIFDVIGSGEALIARSDRGIETVADLRGKIVATPFGSTTHYTVLEALKTAGLDPSDVTLIDLKPQDILAAWSRGDIDAAYVWEPTLSALESQNGRILISSADLVEYGVVTADLGVVRSEFLRQYPHIVEIYLDAQARAVDLINSDRIVAAQIIGSAFGIPQEEIAQQMEGFAYIAACEQFSPRWLGGDMARMIQDTARFLAEQNILSRIPDLSEIAARIQSNVFPSQGGCQHVTQPKLSRFQADEWSHPLVGRPDHFG